MRTCLIFLMLVAVVSQCNATTGDDPQEMPRTKKKVFPAYPAQYKNKGTDGIVEVKAFVTEEGRVAGTEVVSASDPSLVDAAEAAVLQWEFYPATNNGKPIKSEVVIPIHFKRHDSLDSATATTMHVLRDQILGILRGVVVDSTKNLIDLGAYAVVGNRYEYLYSLIFEKSKRDLLIEGSRSSSNFVSIAVNDSEDAALLVLTTHPGDKRAERYHSIVLMKTPMGQWKIRGWHASN